MPERAAVGDAAEPPAHLELNLHGHRVAALLEPHRVEVQVLEGVREALEEVLDLLAATQNRRVVEPSPPGQTSISGSQIASSASTPASRSLFP